MVKGGYILQPRVFGESDASKLPPVTRELWFLLLRGVSHKTGGKYQRGSGFFSLSDIQESLSWYVGYRKMIYSKPQLTKSLRRLCEGSMIATAKATRGVYVTICNYDYYQDPKNYESNGEGSTKVSRKKQEGHAKNKNVEEVRIEEVKETPTSPAKPDSCPHQEIINLYNSKLPELPAVRVWNDSSKKNLRSRWREDKERQNIKWWSDLFDTISESDFLMGKVTEWRASLTWIVGPKNFEKIMNGQYVNHSKQSFGGDW
ncbi:hypothetical protein KAR91_09235 [Candidatus Pacearchaeota archaeon]|nr:hypothetical protein [Candidatus Pacearchaeota archaeon]